MKLWFAPTKGGLFSDLATLSRVGAGSSMERNKSAFAYYQSLKEKTAHTQVYLVFILYIQCVPLVEADFVSF